MEKNNVMSTYLAILLNVELAYWCSRNHECPSWLVQGRFAVIAETPPTYLGQNQFKDMHGKQLCNWSKPAIASYACAIL